MYQNIPPFDKDEFNKAEGFIHQAAQFLAMFGKNFIKGVPDDSNANLGFSMPCIESHVQPETGISVFLNVRDWRIGIKKNDEIIDELPLAGKAKTEVLSWLQAQLNSLGLEGKKLQYITHYEIPSHVLGSDGLFPALDPDLLMLWVQMRSNANLLMDHVNQRMVMDSPICIWPHHFDTGTYYPLSEDKAIGAGWAMADKWHNNPYVYIYGWNKNGALDYSSVPSLAVGRWIIREEWQGAVIQSTTLSEVSEQKDLMVTSIDAIVDFYLKQLQ